MELNFAIFPFPKQGYDVSIFGNQFIQIPAYEKKQQKGKQFGPKIQQSQNANKKSFNDLKLTSNEVEDKDKDNNELISNKKTEEFTKLNFSENQSAQTKFLAITSTMTDNQKMPSLKLSSYLLESLSPFQSSPCKLIPGLHFHPNYKSQQILLFFHGNGEDLSSCYNLAQYMSWHCKVQLVAVEYPKYGVYSSQEVTEEIVLQDAEHALKYLYQQLKSIGSGPAVYLASKFKLGGLFLLSPFTSISQVVKQHIPILTHLIKERFNNFERIKNVDCKIMIVHGKMDTLIHFSQSEQLVSQNKNAQLVLVDDMTHVKFGFKDDLCVYLDQFLKSLLVQ